MAQNFRWLGVLYVVYAAFVWLFTLGNTLFSSQVELQAALMAPLPMLFVGFAFIRGNDWAFRGAFALAIAEVALYALWEFYLGNISPSKLSDSDHFLWEISASQLGFIPGAVIGAFLLLLTIGLAAL